MLSEGLECVGQAQESKASEKNVRGRIPFSQVQRTMAWKRGPHEPEANCSASHNDTSHPVRSKSISPGNLLPRIILSKRVRRQRERLKAVNLLRLELALSAFHSSCMLLQIMGMSIMSARTGSCVIGGRDLTNRLRVRHVMR